MSRTWPAQEDMPAGGGIWDEMAVQVELSFLDSRARSLVAAACAYCHGRPRRGRPRRTMLRMVVAAVNGGCSSRAVFRRILSSSSRSFCAAIGKVEVLAGESALSVERERAMASFACIVLSIGTFTM